MITCLCVIAKQSDERAERMLNRSNGDDSDTFIEDVDMDTIVSMESRK
ncbi:MAG: hypothetical protein MR796_04920 [Veillonella caviae]|nr:hypothetical protein [Veillonella caviae]